jgi:putative transposase
VKVQRACYAEVRRRFELSANLAIRAMARVCTALKVKSKAHSSFEPTSIAYDQRIFSLREWDWTFSLTLLESRQRLVTALGDYQKARLKDKAPTRCERSTTGSASNSLSQPRRPSGRLPWRI